MSLRKVKAQKIKEIFPITNGLFSHMNYTFGDVTNSNLDVLFVSNYGKRNPSPVIETIQDEFGEVLTDANLTTIAAILLEFYKPKWDKLGAVYDIEYDPIHNYLDEWSDENDGSHTNTETFDLNRTDTLDTHVDLDSTRTDNLTETTSGTITRTDNLTETSNDTLERTNTGSVGDSIFGFNSDDAVGSDASATSDTTESSGTNTKTNTGTQATANSTSVTNTGSQVTDSSTATTGTTSRDTTGTQVNEYTDSRDRSGQHFGNIGNLTSQKMIGEEIALWKWNYINEVLNDVKEFCTLPTYRNATRWQLVDQPDED